MPIKREIHLRELQKTVTVLPAESPQVVANGVTDWGSENGGAEPNRRMAVSSAKPNPDQAVRRAPLDIGSSDLLSHRPANRHTFDFTDLQTFDFTDFTDFRL
jgi:hypothetical protein